MKISQIEINENFGIGFVPISIIAEIEKDDEVSCEDVYNQLTIYKCQDIILTGDISTNYSELQWLLPKLTSDMYYVSIYRAPIHDGILDLRGARRLIFEITNRISDRKQLNLLKVLVPEDIIILNMQSVDWLLATRQLLVKNEIKAELFFRSDKVGVSEVIKKDVFDIRPVCPNGLLA